MQFRTIGIIVTFLIASCTPLSYADTKAELSQALLQASEAGDLKTVNSLIERGADVNGKLDGSARGATPLIFAAYEGHSEIVRLLLEKGADINADSWNEGPALMAAIRNNQLSVVRLLLQKGADPNKSLLGLGAKYPGIVETPLMAAVKGGNLQIIKLLLKHGADVNTSTDEGKTALQIARNLKRTQSIRLLKKAGPKEQ